MSWAETKVIIDALKYGMVEVNESQTVNIPVFVDYIWITACGAGGGGGGGYSSSGSNQRIGGGGGGGGDCVVKKLYRVSDRNINITIGKGGTGGGNVTKGTDGGSTVIGSYLTLAGGIGGNGGAASSSTANAGLGGAAGGEGGGDGGDCKGNATNYDGGNGLIGKGGLCASSLGTGQNYGGGGGGGSLGDGGNGAYYGASSATNGTLGGGGGGGDVSSTYVKGGNGGDGYVKIEWGLPMTTGSSSDSVSLKPYKIVGVKGFSSGTEVYEADVIAIPVYGTAGDAGGYIRFSSARVEIDDYVIDGVATYLPNNIPIHLKISVATGTSKYAYSISDCILYEIEPII